MKGRFIIFPGEDKELILPNTVVQDGEKAFLQIMLQGDATQVAPGGNFFMGLCGANLNAQGVLDRTLTLATLLGEPPVANGYARQAFTRDAVGWPIISLVNGVYRAQSKVVNFTAAGGDIGAVARLFFCSVGAGNAGKLYAISAQFPVGTTIPNGITFPAQYELYAN